MKFTPKKIIRKEGEYPQSGLYPFHAEVDLNQEGMNQNFCNSLNYFETVSYTHLTLPTKA